MLLLWFDPQIDVVITPSEQKLPDIGPCKDL
jgi:hypothetical protein